MKWRCCLGGLVMALAGCHAPEPAVAADALQARLVAEPQDAPGAGAELPLVATSAGFRFEGPSFLASQDVIGVEAKSSRQWTLFRSSVTAWVVLRLRPDARERMSNLSARHSGRRLAILLGDELVCILLMDGRQIERDLVIEGSYTPDEAAELADRLRTAVHRAADARDNQNRRGVS